MGQRRGLGLLDELGAQQGGEGDQTFALAVAVVVAVAVVARVERHWLQRQQVGVATRARARQPIPLEASLQSLWELGVTTAGTGTEGWGEKAHQGCLAQYETEEQRRRSGMGLARVVGVVG